MSRETWTYCRALHALLLCCVCTLAAPADAQGSSFGALARVVPEESRLTEDWRGRTILELGLSAGVPWRVYTLRAPDRVVLDFREVDFESLDLRAFDQSEIVQSVTAGPLRAGWSRMVLSLAQPMEIAVAAMDVDDAGSALRLRLNETDRAAFDAGAGAPTSPDWTLQTPVAEAQPAGLAHVFTVVIDPGHGGIDPGAIRQGHEEADLVLQLALELEDALLRSDNVEVVMTRRSDVFVSLERRVAIAAQAQAHAFVSLHADALEEGVAQGATVYMLSQTASDAASAALAERHNRVDLLAGVDLSQADDQVAQVLMDLARHDSAQRSLMLAEATVTSIKSQGIRMHKRPLQQAGFSVLKSADIPSILVEVAFLSTDADLARLLDPVWRQAMVSGLRDGLLTWAQADRAVAPLRRK